MEVAWLIAAVALAGLVQLLVYRYLARRGGPGARAVDAPTGVAPAHAAVREPDSGAEERVCPACGALNGPEFTFCRRCVSRLAA